MKIKVLETIRQGLIGGGETHLLSLVEHLDKNAFEPSVLSFTEGPMVDRARAMGLKTEVIHTERPFDFTVWKRVKQLMKDWQIEIVHAHGTRAASNTLWPAKSNHIPLIYTVHGWSFHQDQPALVRMARIQSEKYITARTQVNICVSASNRDTGKACMKNFDAVVIPNGIDQAKFDPSRKYKDIRAEIGIPADAILVLFAARFTNHKQPLKVVEGYYRAQKIIPSMRLLMVGEGDAKEETMERVNKLGISDRVYFQNFRSDVPDLLAASDIFVLASLWEGMAISLLEAMSMGKAVVASRVDGNCEVVEHMHNGWLVDLEGIEANLCEAFTGLSQNERLKKKLEEEAIRTIHEKYSAAVMTRQTEEVYHKLIHQRARSKHPHYAYGI